MTSAHNRSAPVSGGGSYDRAALSARLRRVLTDNPRVSHFTLHHIVKALEADDAAAPVALFAAADIFRIPGADDVSGAVTTALGARMLSGGHEIRLPRALLQRKIPRSALALLVHGLASVLDKADGMMRERWSWMFHPLMTGTLGITLFLLGLVSMAPIIGGGVQHAASAFFIALGIAERDGLVVMIGAVAGIACIALALLSVSSGRKLWGKIKTWLLQCARRLHLDALTRLLDHCCEGLGELLRMRWSGLLLVLLSPAAVAPPPPRPEGTVVSAFRKRARRARLIGILAHKRLTARSNEP